ncbi:response regulator [Actinomadura fibrosa]|uniref:Response regulator n=1 Tax=Actinomadura fibrosa TaxID=111802 RepID=A0ABW2Y103_9ACTN
MDALIRVGAIDDDRMLLEGLRSWTEGVADLRLAATAPTVSDFLGARPGALDLVLLDLTLADGSDPARNVRRLVDAGHRALVVSVLHDAGQIAATFAAGAHGYVTKDHDLDALSAAIRQVAGGATAFSPELALACLRDPRPRPPRLSRREEAVLVAYASGMTLASAARHAGVRPGTAKTYLDRVKAKYQRGGRAASTKLDLAERAREDGLLPVPARRAGR